MYTIYEEHIEQLEEENQDLKQELVFLRKIVEFYRGNVVDINEAKIDD